MATEYDPFLRVQIENTSLHMLEEELAMYTAKMDASTTYHQRSEGVVENIQHRLFELQNVVEASTTAFNQSEAEQRKREMAEKVRLAEIAILKLELEQQQRATAKQAELVEYERKIAEKEMARSDDTEKSKLNWLWFAIFGVWVFSRLKLK